MRKIWSVAASAAVVVLCGCQHTHVDQVRAGDGMNDWYQDIKDNYPGFRPPRLISPGISGQTGPAAVVSAQNETAGTSVESSNTVEPQPVDPVPVQDSKVESNVVVKEQPVPEVKAEVKSEANVDAKVEAKAQSETKKIEPPDPTSGEIYVVQYGDTLGALSKKFYGSVRYVNLLQKANSDIVTNANVLKPGMKLIIPKL